MARLFYFSDDRFDALHPRGQRGRFISKQSFVDAAVAKINEAFQRDGIPEEMAARFRETLNGVFRSMSAGGMKRLHDRIGTWNFHPSMEAIKKAHRNVGGENDKNRDIGGFFVPRTDGLLDIHLDGGKDTGQNYKNVTAHTYRHEIAHILDGLREPYLSSSQEWKVAWHNEIDNYLTVPLTLHATISAREGFAEWGRLLLTDRNLARKNFPLCWEFWKKHNLV